MTFSECVLHCFDNKELVYEFNRLTGNSIEMEKDAFLHELLVSEEKSKPVQEFIDFIKEFIWESVSSKNICALCRPEDAPLCTEECQEACPLTKKEDSHATN